MLKADVSAEGLPDHEFTSKPFTAADLKDGRFSFTSEWHAEKLWDINTPQNMYEVKPLAPGGRLQGARRRRCRSGSGSGRFWINGRDFYLNGSRIYLFGLPLDNAWLGAAWATYNAARETMLRMKSFGTNFVYGHNYGCAPGTHLSYAEILRAADDAGMLLALPMPHFQDYDWKAPDAEQTNGYAAHAEYYVRYVAENHPSVVAYAMSHNACGYFGDEGPGHDRRHRRTVRKQEEESPNWPDSTRRMRCARRRSCRRFDTTRIIYHHGCGDLGEMSTVELLPQLHPRSRRLDDWFGPWSAKGTHADFPVRERLAALAGISAMYRGWYNGGRAAWAAPPVPWELCVAQWNAQFTRRRGFPDQRSGEDEMRWESRSVSHQRAAGITGTTRSSSSDVDAIKPVHRPSTSPTTTARGARGGCRRSMRGNTRATGHCAQGADTGRKDLKVDWENLQQPGFSPDYIAGRLSMAMATDFKRSRLDAGRGRRRRCMRNNMPLLAYIARQAGIVHRARSTTSFPARPSSSRWSSSTTRASR